MAQITLNSTGVASDGALVLQSNGTTAAVTIDTSQNVGIGVTPSAGQLLVVGKNITGAVQSAGVSVNGTIQSGVTSVTWGVRTNLSTVASAFTLANLRHHDATQGTFGAGSTVTNQAGFFVDNSLIGATNNYGFFGNIPSGTNRWNFYAGGTADNYFAGNVGIGKNNPSTKLEVAGSVATALIRINRTDNAAARGALQWTGNDGVVDWQIGTNMVASGGLEFSTASASGLLMTLDTTGNLGIGVTPSAWGSGRAIEVGAVGTALWSFTATDSHLSQNAYYTSTWRYASTAAASTYRQTIGQHQWFNAPSGTIGNLVTFTQAMTLDASGNLGIGTSSPAALLDVDKSQNSTTSIRVGNTNAGSSANSRLIAIADAGNIQVKAMSSTNTTYGAADCGVINCDTMAGGLRFAHNDTVGMTFSAAGNLGIGTNSPAFKLEVVGGTNNGIHIKDAASATVFGGLFTQAAALTLVTRSNHALTLGTNDTERMRIDSSGNVGIGTTTPSYKLQIFGASNPEMRLGDATVTYQLYTEGATAAVMGTTTNHALVYRTNATERMRITSAGDLLLGTTAQSSTPSTGVQLNNAASGTLGYVGIGHASGVATGNPYANFAYNSTLIGSITQSGTTAVLYNVTSDQRLKENIQDAASASSLIDLLQVRQFDWKTDNSHQRYGFIAQELVSVAPEAVHQPVNEEDMMAVDYSKLVPMLVKEIQSLRQRLAALETN